MKDAIERVIAELEDKYAQNRVADEYENGYDDALIYSISLLKEVLAEHETDNSRDASEPE